MFRRLFLSVLVAVAPPLAALAQVPAVIADTPVAQSLTAQVLGDLGTPGLLLDRGADPHHFQLRPSQARAVAHADLVVWTSSTLSPWMVSVIESLAPDTALELASVPGLVTRPLTDWRSFGDAAEEDEETGDTDPHQWLDPANARVWLRALADRLAAMDPQNAATYAANADAAQSRIDALSAEVEQVLAPVGDAGLVMYHDAYGYFADRFGLTVLGTIALSDAVAPGAARLTALRAALSQAGAVCIFPESNHPDRYTSLVAEGAQMRIGAPLDPAGVMLDPGPDLYARTLLGLARSIADCVTATATGD